MFKYFNDTEKFQLTNEILPIMQTINTSHVRLISCIYFLTKKKVHSDGETTKEHIHYSTNISSHIKWSTVLSPI